MSEFEAHESCPNCGGSDPLARYTDGHAYCFSCGYYEGANLFKKLETLKRNKVLGELRPCAPLPPQLTPMSGALDDEGAEGCFFHAYSWLRKYEITSDEMRKYNFAYSGSMESLIMPVYDELGTLRMWQQRCFHPKAQHKYITRGFKESFDLIIGNPLAHTAVLVEDYISAIRVGRQYTAIPLFGSEISIERRTRLSNQFKNIVLWLDDDKWFHANTWKSENRPWFDSITCVRSSLDPKGLTDDTIKKKLQGIA